MSIVITDKSKCSGCSACYSICPNQCIQMQKDNEGFLYPEIDEDLCSGCGACEKICPIKNDTNAISYKEPLAYVAYSLDEKIRQDSSSGGIVSVLANEIIKEKGIVFGAALSEDCKTLFHTRAENTKDLRKLLGSKYLQSDIGDTFIDAKTQLEQGRKVLFVGTPCEVEGLHRFLKKDYENLWSIDLICHGAPSPLLWEKYVVYRERKAKSHVQQTFFRHKYYGWKMFVVLFIFVNNTTYRRVFKKDSYMQMFLQNLCLRPSCYNCVFKKINRVSDITLGDFWGCGKICPELDDDKGLSLVIVHSEKGKKMMSQIKSLIRMQAIPFEASITGNMAMVKSCEKPERRDEFMQSVGNYTFEELDKSYVKHMSIKMEIVIFFKMGRSFLRKITKRT